MTPTMFLLPLFLLGCAAGSYARGYQVKLILLLAEMELTRHKDNAAPLPDTWAVVEFIRDRIGG